MKYWVIEVLYEVLDHPFQEWMTELVNSWTPLQSWCEPPGFGILPLFILGSLVGGIILYTSVFRWLQYMKSIWNPYEIPIFVMICAPWTTERISAGSPKDDPGCFWSSTVHWLLDTPWTFMACNAAASWSSRGSVDAVEQSWLPMAITGNQELRPKSPSDSHVVPGVAPIFHELWDFELSNFQQCIWSTPVFFWGCCADSFWCFKAARRIGNDSDRQHFWTYCFLRKLCISKTCPAILAMMQQAPIRTALRLRSLPWSTLPWWLRKHPRKTWVSLGITLILVETCRKLQEYQFQSSSGYHFSEISKHNIATWCTCYRFFISGYNALCIWLHLYVPSCYCHEKP